MEASVSRMNLELERRTWVAIMEGQSQDDSDNVTEGDRVGPSEDDSRCANVDLPFSPSPEVLFLIKSHAKTISAINNISKKLEQLEVKVCDISKQSSHRQNVGTTKCSNKAIDSGKCHQHSCAAHVLSDDSGGEYSRSTHTNGTATDEDELMSLLDQIGRCSQSIRDTRQGVNQSSLSRVDYHPIHDVQHPLTATSQPGNNQRVTQSSLSRVEHHPIHDVQHLLTPTSQPGNNQRVTSASGHLLSKTPLHQYEGLTHRSSPAAINHSFGLTPTPVVHHPFNHVSSAHPPSTSYNHPPSSSYNHPPSTSYNHHHSASLNALLFDPNVSRVLSSLSDELVVDDNQKFLFGAGPSYTEHPGTQHSQSHHHPLPFAGGGGVSGRPFQRSLPTTRQPSLHLPHDLVIPASIATSTPVSSNHPPSRRWEMDRALQLVHKRKQDTVQAQYDLADQWLARQMNSKSSPGHVASSSSSSVTSSAVAVPLASSSSIQGSSNNSTTVTLRSPPSSSNNSTTVKTSSLSQIPSSSRAAGQRVTINSTHPSSSSQIQVTSNSQLSPSAADIRHPIVHSNMSHSNTFRSQTGIRSHHLSPSSPVATSEHSSQSGSKGVPSSSSNPVAEVGSSSLLRKQAINSSRYNSSNSNHNHNSNSNSSKRWRREGKSERKKEWKRNLKGRRKEWKKNGRGRKNDGMHYRATWNTKNVWLTIFHLACLRGKWKCLFVCMMCVTNNETERMRR